MSTITVKSILQLIQDQGIKFVDLRFTDTLGKEQHVTVSAQVVDADFLKLGKTFDGSSIAGWRHIHHSDMVLEPDLNTTFVDPFFEEPTLVVRCNIIDPTTHNYYVRDPRAVAQRAEAFLIKSGIADVCYLGPEPEFFIFDDVRYQVSMEKSSFAIDSAEGAWNSNKKYTEGNSGHRPTIKGGYFPVPPVDSSQDLRSAICLELSGLGYHVETHHHEVATANQNEINLRYSALTAKADEMQVFKYVVHNVAETFGKTATFMPKPLAGDNGSGMHCHISLFKNNKNLFTGDEYGGLSTTALYFIGGIIQHARALNAFTNPSTNSYKRLVPGFEAPVLLAYSACNRSASIRIPYVQNPKARRIEVRFPDNMANPYLAFSALLLAGLDGIKNKIDPGAASDEDLYALSDAALKHFPHVCASLDEALQALEQDHQFLLTGDVFSEDLIQAYIDLKMKEVTALRAAPHPIEFQMYYSL